MGARGWGREDGGGGGLGGVAEGVWLGGAGGAAGGRIPRGWGLGLQRMRCPPLGNVPMCLAPVLTALTARIVVSQALNPVPASHYNTTTLPPRAGHRTRPHG